MSSQNTDTRTRILEATIETLEKAGGRGVRMGDIAKATGISRQAVYLHFKSRTELLVSAIRYTGDQLDVDRKLAPSRAATSGVERLDLYIEFWGNYIPEIYGMARALMADQHTDEAAAAAWQDRMIAMRDGCRAAIDALHADGNLAAGWTRPKAIDALWTLLLVPNWENLTQQCGWSTRQYIRHMQAMAKRIFVESRE
ncbi:MAG: TetR/AcrR family transcriptional regulator [Xanthomonadales bacterium]|nr:TetR/AcrR family transcriptional regulator [Xanthomonadales bacterium]